MNNTTNLDNIILQVNSLKKYFPIKKGFLKRTIGYVKAVDGVDLFIREGECLGLVGESGCGKTTLGRCIVRLLEPTEGDILFHAKSGETVNLALLDAEQLRPLRKEFQIIFQDPFSSLSPRMMVEDIIAEPLVIHNIGDKNWRKERVKELLELVGLSPEYAQRYPHEFSGGQRQRIGIARALALEPRLIICDEPVSALDVSVRAQVINLLRELQHEKHLTYLFISHDLSVIEHISDRVAVMYLGKIVEIAKAETLYQNPKHPYTEGLLSVIPLPNPNIRLRKESLLSGEVASPINLPSGCYFHPRCKYARDICKKESPQLRALKDDSEHFVACHFSDELSLAGVNVTLQV